MIYIRIVLLESGRYQEKWCIILYIVWAFVILMHGFVTQVVKARNLT